MAGAFDASVSSHHLSIFRNKIVLLKLGGDREVSEMLLKTIISLVWRKKSEPAADQPSPVDAIVRLLREANAPRDRSETEFRE